MGEDQTSDVQARSGARIVDALPSLKDSLAPVVRDLPLGRIAQREVLMALLDSTGSPIERHADLLGGNEDALRDIIAVRATPINPETQRALRLLQFSAALTGLGTCCVRGELVRAGDWVQASLADEDTFGAEAIARDVYPHRVAEMLELSSVVADAIPHMVAEWTRFAFQYFRTLNALPDVAAVIADACVENAQRLLDDDELRELAIRALLEVAYWAAKNDVELATRIASLLESLYDRGISPVQILMGLMSVLGQWTTRGSERAWALLASKYEAELTPAQELRTLLALATTPLEYERLRERILTCIGDLHRTGALASASRYEKAVWLSSAFEVYLAPLIKRLAETAHGGHVVELLSAWYNVPEPERRENLLVFLPYTDRGLMVVYGNDATIDAGVTHTAFQEAVEDVNAALNLVFSVEGGVNTLASVPELPERLGTGVEGAGPRLLRAVRKAYGLDRLADQVLPDGVPFVVLNTMPLNVQSAAFRLIGRHWPNAISLRAPLPDARIHRVGMWHRPMIGSEAKASAVMRRLADAGIETVYEESRGADDIERFTALYGRGDLEVIWIIGHAAFRPYAAHHSSLDILASGSVSLEFVAGMLSPPREDRRLLVLNVCNAGNVAGLSGVAQAGLAGLLTSPQQATVAHLWSADLVAAPAFGILLADRLATGEPFFESFVGAMVGLDRSNADIAHRLEQLDVDTDLVHRVRGAEPPMSDYVRSGSAVFYE